jgi:uncharacterized protein YxjI
MLEIAITSHAFSSGFDIETPLGSYSAKRKLLSAKSETSIQDAARSPVARIEKESFLSNVTNVFIAGGPQYQLSRQGFFGCNWTCAGEGRTLQITSRSSRNFQVMEHNTVVAECKRDWFSGHSSIRVEKDSDFKLMMCLSLFMVIEQADSADAAVMATIIS